MAPEFCPNCGAEVPQRARACPECGSCPETGWSEEARVSGLGLPEENWDYDDFVRREFGPRKGRRRPRSWFWWVVGVLVLLAFLGLAL